MTSITSVKISVKKRKTEYKKRISNQFQSSKEDCNFPVQPIIGLRLQAHLFFHFCHLLEILLWRSIGHDVEDDHEFPKVNVTITIGIVHSEDV